jgi:hypothetical protein
VEGGGELTRRVLLGRAALAGAVVLGADQLGAPQPAAARRTRRRVGPGARATFGAELEYYRSDPDHLEQRLRQCAAAGYTTIQTYVPWNVHESSRGALDFTGRTEPVILNDHADEYQIETPDQQLAGGGVPARVIANTDLLGFIRACARHGFDVILRPGPFISDEWRNGGLPDWLLLAYPDMFQRGPHGTALEPGAPFSPPAGAVTGGGPLFYFAGPSYASEEYLREARRWMTTFAATVAPYLRSRGGPVSAMQVDDEICFYYRFGPFEVDYHPSMVARFGAEPPTDWPAPGGPVAALRPALEWQRFKARQLGVFLSEMAAALRAGGADVPIGHEEELQLSPPANLAEVARAVDVLHPEFYLDPGPWSQPALELCAAAVRGAQRLKRDVIAAEMSAGDVFLRHLLIGEGMSGFLGFSYTQGVPDEAVEEMGVLGRTLRLAGPRLASSDRVADTAIVWCPEYLYAPYEATKYGFARDVRNAIERDIPALATLLIRAGLAFDLLDTDVAQPEDYERYPTIWLVAADVLPRSCQEALVHYVRRGGRLVCWPEPPGLDEDYEPCTVLRDALYPEALGPAYPDDGQVVTVMGTAVRVWRGVQTFRLSAGATPVARRGSDPCGYARRLGRGEAFLLGTWPVADSVPGREGAVFDMEDVPSTGGAGALARSIAARHWGAATARAVRTDPPPAAGRPEKVIVFEYSNERRGGEVVTGGTVAYWDGENVVPIADVNVGATVPEVTTPPFRPITPAHLDAARALHGRPPACAVTDHRAQVRLLRARAGEAATVSVVNRYSVDIRVAITTRHRGRAVRLPLAGEIELPAGGALLLPLDYRLAPHVTVEQATVQLLDAHVGGRTLRLSVRSPRGGEIVLRLPARPTRATVDGRPAEVSRRRGLVKIAVPRGARELEIGWR